MINELIVLMGDCVAGRIYRQHGALRFVYDQSYRNRSDPTPLSVTMPVETAEHKDQVLISWLWGLLPDNERVLARWAQAFHVANSPFALLGTPVGEDCAGAVRFVTEERLGDAVARTGQVDWLDESGVAARLRELERDGTSWLGGDFAGRFSLAGAQAKTALLCRDGRWGIPSGAAATSHILKPAISGLDDHDLNEHLCLRAARQAGLVVVNTDIMTFEDQSAIVIERYDRLAEGSGWLRRIHQEDFCQASGNPPALKYQNEGGPGSRDVVGLLRRLLPGKIGTESVWRFFDAMTLNWLICGTDAHSKNYSLLLAGRQVRLAPLYDVASALPYELPIQKMRLAMKYGDSYLLTTPSKTIWTKISKELGLQAEAVRERATSLMDRLPDAFADAARDPAVRAVGSMLPGRLVDAVTGRVELARSALDSDQN